MIIDFGEDSWGSNETEKELICTSKYAKQMSETITPLCLFRSFKGRKGIAWERRVQFAEVEVGVAETHTPKHPLFTLL